MTNQKRIGRKKGSPKALIPEVRRLISERAVEESNAGREDMAIRLISEIESNGWTAPTIETAMRYISDARSKLGDELDKPWNTAALNNDEPISSEIIPYLIRLQIQRKHFLSKPVTIREAKWYNRLSGFKNIIKFILPEMENDREIKSFYLTNYIATWAHFYARREIIDQMSRIKDVDYTDLDEALLNSDSQYVFDYKETFFFKELENNNAKKDSKANLLKFSNSILTPSASDMIWHIEYKYMGHSLGATELPDNSIFYKLALMTLTSNPDFDGKLLGLSYKNKVLFFSSLRQHVKEYSQDKNDEDIVSLISELLQR